jgi:hypothetical protein
VVALGTNGFHGHGGIVLPALKIGPAARAGRDRYRPDQAGSGRIRPVAARR